MVNVYCLDFIKDSSTPQLGAFSAYKGFQTMGSHCKIVSNVKEIIDLNKEDIAVGGIGFVKNRLSQLGINHIEPLDYPLELRSYLGRQVWESNFNSIKGDEGIFIKPKQQKFFTGLLVTSPKDLISKAVQGQDYGIWCSEPIELISEYRVFVRYSKILDIRRYKGDFKVIPNYSLIENCIKDYKNSPLAYGIDFGITKSGKTVLIEVNDGFALGDYGLFYLDYAKLMYTRWSEIVNCKDYFNFN